MARVKSLRVLFLAAGWLLALGWWGTPGQAAEYTPLPPAPPTGITPDWLIHDAARNRLIIYLPGYHAPAHAYYQWVRVQRGQAFPLSFTAEPGLSIFLNNQLLFTARAASTYALDLGQPVPRNAGPGPHLLGVWQPEGSPVLASFSGAGPAAEGKGVAKADVVQAHARLPAPQGQNVFLSFLLLLGLLYGGVRSTYRSGMARIFQVEELFSSGSDQQSFLTKPAFSLLNLLLVLLFSLSFALLLTAIRTDLYNLPLLRRFFDVPETAIVGRVLLYTAVIAGYVLGKYLYVALLGYIFDLQGLVSVQYREFLRSTLLAGLFLPVVLLLHLGLNTTFPRTVSWAATAAIGLLLVVTVLRVARTLHHHAPLLNLHLFAYLCATEVLPLLVLLKLIVFAY